jgi:ATP-dependent DNA helicase RecG
MRNNKKSFFEIEKQVNVNQAILIIRYRNRLEIQNPGYSLKPISELEKMGSKQRNPIIAAVLYDLNFAETKGSGIRTMQNLLKKVGLTKPVFSSDRQSNQFTTTFLLHQLFDEEQLRWLMQFKHLSLSNDETKALVLVKEMRAIDNAALRAVTDLDTLSASQVLRKLSIQYQLIEKGGNGPASYYKPTRNFLESMSYERHSSNRGNLGPNKGDLSSNKGDLGSNKSDLPDELSNKINELTPKARASALRPIIIELLLSNSYTAEELGNLLRRDIKALKTNHLTPMRKEGLIEYLYPEVVNHPEQAYQVTNKSKKWLKEAQRQCSTKSSSAHYLIKQVD